MSKKQQYSIIGVGVLCLPAFFLLMHFLGLFGSRIEYSNPVYVAKMIVAFSPLFVLFYWVGYMMGGHWSGFRTLFFWFALFVIAFVGGAMRN